MIENELGYTLINTTLRHYIRDVTIDAKCIFSERELDTYIRLFEIIQHFDLEDNGMGYVLGDYYLREGNKEKALFYYESIFKPGFDLYLYGYYYSLSRYINLLDDQKKIEVLKSLIDNTPIEGSYELDYVDTYLSLIVNLDKKSNEYLSYIEEGIKVVLPFSSFKVISLFKKSLISSISSITSKVLCPISNKNSTSGYSSFM